MHIAQLITYGVEDRWAQAIQELAKDRGLWLRPVSHLQACLNVLRKSGPAILVLKVGRDLEKELTILERVSWLFPETATIVVGESDYPMLAVWPGI